MDYHSLTVASMGHPQHGKSSLLGCIALHFRGEEHLNVLLKAVEKKVEELHAPELRYALLFDLPKNDFALREQMLQQRDPTKTVSRTPGWVGCRIGDRSAMLVDEPGHPQFLRYIVAPSAAADVGILVVEALAFQDEHRKAVDEFGPGCFTNSAETKTGRVPFLLSKYRESRQARIAYPRRAPKSWFPHLCTGVLNYASLCELFDIRHLVVAVHKLDQANFKKSIFDDVQARLKDLVAIVGDKVSMEFVPTAVLAASEKQHNVTSHSAATRWYQGPTVAEKLVALAGKIRAVCPNGPLRMQVERVAKGSRHQQYALPPRIFGRIDSGVLKKNDTVVLYPSGMAGTVKSIHLRDESRAYSDEPYWEETRDIPEADSGSYVSVAFDRNELSSTLGKGHPHIHWQGQILSHEADPPNVSNRLRARLQIVPPWWLEENLTAMTLFYGYQRITCKLPWEPGQGERWWETMTVDIQCDRSFALDVFRPGGSLGKIVLEREGFFVAGGTIVEVLPAEETSARKIRAPGEISRAP